ncbi:MAG: hypothetical protein RL653_2898 [Pseudomonadota bacterium]|jgi:hypothetical protein
MAPTVEALRAQLEPFFLAHAERRLAHALGAPLELGPLRAGARALFSPEAFQAVSEAAAASTGDPDRALSLRRLRRYLALEGTRLRASGAEADAHALLAGAPVHWGTQSLPLGQALREAAGDPSAVRRQGLAAAASQVLLAHPAPFVAQHQALQRTAERLSGGGVLPFLESLDGSPLQPLAEAAGELLALTEDGHREVLTYVLHRVDARLVPLRARWHDVQHAAPARWLGILRREELVGLVDHWLSEQGLSLHGHGKVERVELPSGHGPGRAHVVPLRVPRDVRLVYGLGGGVADASRLFRAHGEAVAFTHRPPGLGAELRLVADEGPVQLAATAFERRLADARWLRRYAGLSAPAARDAARVAAFGQLTALRRACARLRWAVSLHAKGTLEHAEDAYVEGLSRASGVGVERGEWLPALPGALDAAAHLRGAGLEAALAGTWAERFGDDHFRNPAAGTEWRLLLGMAPREGADGLLRLLGRDALPLREAGQRLLAVLNA